MSRHAASGTVTGRPRISLAVSRADLTDAGFLLLLGALALIGFRTTYTGWQYLIAGMAGLLLGIVIAHLANALRQPLIVLAVMATGVFFLLGGAVAVRPNTVAGFLPNLSTLQVLARQGVHGWKDLLTTVPPVDGSGPLLVLPYIIGLFGGVGGFFIARRTKTVIAALAAPVLMLLAVILLGVQTPAAQLLQGAVFAVVGLAWAALRALRVRPTLQNGSGQRARALTSVALLLLAGLSAAILGPHLPGSGSHARMVLRTYVQPPVELDKYPSPLAAFRKYKTTDKDQILFKGQGNLPAGQLLSIATLDDYNGFVWSATNKAGTAGEGADAFKRVGSRVPLTVKGTRFTLTISVPDGGYADVWLPNVGMMSSIAFRGATKDSHETFLRYNEHTGTAVLADGVRPGDQYTVRGVLPTSTTKSSTVPKDADFASVTGELDAGTTFVAQKTSQWVAGASSVGDKIASITQRLKTTGFYSDGIDTARAGGQTRYLPGHFMSRIAGFLNARALVGDDEQYAATLALMLNSKPVGVPARVILGASPEPTADGFVVKGSDVHAWVEVKLLNGSWKAIGYDTFMPDPNKMLQAMPKTEAPPKTGNEVPPPAVSHPKTAQADGSAIGGSSSQQPKKKRTGMASLLHAPGWLVAFVGWVAPPTLMIAFVCALIVGLKAFRRYRRRTSGPPERRLAHGWREVLDHARDLGASVPFGHTRREQAAHLAHHDLHPLAHLADAHIFGPGNLADTDAENFWKHVQEHRRRMSAGVSRSRRLRAALNLRSLVTTHKPKAARP